MLFCKSACYKNYLMGISRYKIVPLIRDKTFVFVWPTEAKLLHGFPKKDMNLRRVLDRIKYPITVYRNGKIHKKVIGFFEGLASEFKYKLEY